MTACIMRAPHNGANKFTQISNKLIMDKNLSNPAKVLHTYFLSLPKGWKICHRHVSIALGRSMQWVCRNTRELVEKGYAARERIRAKNGRLEHYKYILRETKDIEHPAFNQLTQTTTGEGELVPQETIPYSKTKRSEEKPTIPTFPSKEVGSVGSFSKEEGTSNSNSHSNSEYQNLPPKMAQEPTKQVEQYLPTNKQENEPIVKIHAVFAECDLIPQEEKARLTDKLKDESLVKKVIDYLKRPDIGPTNSFIGRMCYFYENPTHMKGEKKVASEKRKKMKAFNEQTWKSFKSLHAKSSSTGLTLSETSTSAFIYDIRDVRHALHFSDDNFVEQLESALRKIGLYQLFDQFLSFVKGQLAKAGL